MIKSLTKLFVASVIATVTLLALMAGMTQALSGGALLELLSPPAEASTVCVQFGPYRLCKQRTPTK
jgi:hypothetical protein